MYEKKHKGCAFDGIGDEIIVRDITDKDVKTILSKKGKCFVEVNYENRLSMPSNGLGHQKLVLHITNETE